MDESSDMTEGDSSKRVPFQGSIDRTWRQMGSLKAWVTEDRDSSTPRGGPEDGEHF